LADRINQNLYQLIVIFVGANPHPFDQVAYEVTDGTMMIAYTDLETVTGAAFELFKVEREMMMVALPKIVTFSPAPRTCSGQCVV